MLCLESALIISDIKPFVYSGNFLQSNHSINKTDIQQVKQGKSETYNYTLSKRTTAGVNYRSLQNKTAWISRSTKLHIFGYGFLGSLGSNILLLAFKF